MASKIVNGSDFLTLPDGVRFRSISLITNKPMLEVGIKTGLRKDALGQKTIGFYSIDERTREETSSCMSCPSVCRFLIMDRLERLNDDK